MARVQRRDIGGGQHRRLGELGPQPVDQRAPVAVEHPQRQPERPHVLAAQRFLVAQAKGLHRLQSQRRNIEGQQLPTAQAAILQRVDGIFRLFEVPLRKLAAVGDDQPAGLKRPDIDLQRRRIHRHQHVGGIARGADLARSEIDLKRRDAKQRPLRRADFGGKIGKGRQVIARQRGGQGKLPAGQLHPVARIPAKRTTTASGMATGAGWASGGLSISVAISILFLACPMALAAACPA